MQKALILAALFWVANGNASSSKHPFALLGDDFGVLNENDFATNACEASPVPFSGKPYSSYPYWQCFPNKGLALVCDITMYDADEKSWMAILAIVINQKEGDQEYLSRRAIAMENCRWFQKKWKTLTHAQTHVCLSGPFNRYKVSDQGEKTTYWTFDKFKTQKGCVSFFHGQCDLPYLIKQGACSR